MNISCTNKMKSIYPKYISKLLIPVLSAGALFGFGCSPSKKVVEVPKVSLEKVVHYDFGDLGKLNIEDGFFEAQDFLTRVNVCEKGSLSDTRVNDWKTIAGFVNNSVNYDGKSLSANVCEAEADVLFEDSNKNGFVDLEEKIINISGFSPAKEKLSNKYVVSAGDNLWNIAKRVNSSDVRGTLNLIIEENNLENGSYIRPGQILRIPSNEIVYPNVDAIIEAGVSRGVGNLNSEIDLDLVEDLVTEKYNLFVTETTLEGEIDTIFPSNYIVDEPDYIDLRNSKSVENVVNIEILVLADGQRVLRNSEGAVFMNTQDRNLFYEFTSNGKPVDIVSSDNFSIDVLNKLYLVQEVVQPKVEVTSLGSLEEVVEEVVRPEVSVERQEVVYDASQLDVDSTNYSAPVLADENTNVVPYSVSPSVDFEDGGEESLSLYDLFSMAGGSFRDVAVPDDERENYMRNYLNRQAGVEETDEGFPDAVTNGSLENILGEAYGTKVAVNSLYHNSDMSVREIQEQFRGVNIYEHIEGAGRKAKITGYVNERADAVRGFYDNGEGMKVSQLAEQYGVSTSTIRRDLKRDLTQIA